MALVLLLSDFVAGLCCRPYGRFVDQRGVRQEGRVCLDAVLFMVRTQPDPFDVLADHAILQSTQEIHG
eukprot:SAG31_NODE_159_length_21911_cov_12.220750_3_plen_68_part_00